MTLQPTKIAIPLQGERISGHFGHPECFTLVSVDPVSRKVLGEQRVIPPPHEPGRLPVWLAERGATVVLASGIGPRAVNLLEDRGIEVRTGVPDLTAAEAVRLWLEGNLKSADNTCDHGESSHQCGDHE